MTKVPYDAARFNQLALRMFDLACDFRAMGALVGEERLSNVQLHDRKPQEWLGKLELWTADARRRLKEERIRQTGDRRARAFLKKMRRISAGEGIGAQADNCGTPPVADPSTG